MLTKEVELIDNELNSICFFTICSKNFMAYARTLYFALKKQYPDLVFYVALCDDVAGLKPQPFEIVELSALNIPDIEGMSKKYNITEFNTAIKPFVFNHLFTKKNHQNVIYLDPDILVIDRFIEVEQAFLDGAEAILTPHILSPAENVEVHDQKMLMFGIYNLGFLALHNSDQVRNIVSWWGRKLETECVINVEGGLFVDQKWADLLPAFIENAYVLRHPGYNVAYWNLSQRKVTKTDDSWSVNSKPLRFVHFSGNKLDEPNTFSRHSVEVTTESIGDLKQLLDEYRQLVFDNEHSHYSELEYTFNWDGESGVNLHTPRPEQEANNTLLPLTVENSQGNQAKKINSFKKLKAWRQTILSIRNISGGWKPLSKRVYLKIRKDGLSATIRRALLACSQHSVSSSQSFESTIDIQNKVADCIVFIDWSTPRPDKDAGSITAFYLLKILANLKYNVIFIPSDLERLGAYTDAIESLGVTCLHKEDIGSVELFLENSSFHIKHFFLCRAPIAALYIDAIRRNSPQSSILLNTSDLHYLREYREAELAGKLADKNVKDYIQHIKETELNTIKKCDTSIVMSTSELSIMEKELPDCDIRHIPLMFIDIEGEEQPYEERENILFIGGFPHQPNVDAVIFFCNEIWPIVSESLPNVEFIIIGSEPPEEVLQLSNIEGVTVVGYVKDLAPYFNSIRISVAPLRYGAGIKGKLGTSLGFGVPSVATSIAVEGMPLIDGQNICIADIPEEFAQKTIDLYTSEKQWNQLSEAGKNLVIKEYSIEKGMDRISKLLTGISACKYTLDFKGISSFYEYEKFLKINNRELSSQRELERELIEYEEPSFRLEGKCAVCEKNSSFNVSFMYAYENTNDGKKIPNWREHLDCEHCKLVNRVRAAVHYFKQEIKPELASKIYITEQVTPLFRWLKQKYTTTVGSEYFGNDSPLGEEVNGIRNEDLMNLTFNDNTFDYILSFDVLEHVPNPDKAFRQIYRCLKPGGEVLFSAPFSSKDKKNIIRASLNDDGTIEHHLPAEYHGNPVDHENGALCFQYFGWDMIEQLNDIGFTDSKALFYWSDQLLYLGSEQFLFRAKKPL